MPAVNPELEELRRQVEEQALKQRATKAEMGQHLVLQCEQCALTWSELPPRARERICRSVDTAPGERGFSGLVHLLRVDDVDARFCHDRASGKLIGPTQLMLEDVERSRHPPLPAASLLTYLLQHGFMRCLGEVERDVLEACARRRQTELLRVASDSSMSADSVMESGYSSLDGDREIVGTVDAPPDATLVEATPTRSMPLSDTTELKPPPGPRLLLTYAADGREAALQVADRLKEFRFRTLLLEEQQRWRLPEPYTAVQKWFAQVDYAVCLLTPGYLAATQNLARPRTEQERRLAEDARFVYSLMCAELEKNQHVNWRVRALVPDWALSKVRDHSLYGSPLFRWPFLVSDLEELAECLAE